MGNNYDIILIGLVAVFLILRLRSVLGKRTGNERPPARDPLSPPPPPAPRAGDGPAGASGRQDNVVPLPTAAAPPRPSLAVTGPGGIRATVMPTATAAIAASGVIVGAILFMPPLFMPPSCAAINRVLVQNGLMHPSIFVPLRFRQPHESLLR